MGTNHLNEQYPYTGLQFLTSEHGAFLIPRVEEVGRRDQKIGLRRVDLWENTANWPRPLFGRIQINQFLKSVCVSEVGFISVWLTSKYIIMTWETIAAQKRDALRASIPTKWIIPADILPPEDQKDVTNFPKASGWFTQHELEITSTPATQILLNIATGSWSSEEVTRCFCKAAAAAHQLVNTYPQYT